MIYWRLSNFKKTYETSYIWTWKS